jgi:hypothetical protein
LGLHSGSVTTECPCTTVELLQASGLPYKNQLQILLPTSQEIISTTWSNAFIRPF